LLIAGNCTIGQASGAQFLAFLTLGLTAHGC